MAMDYQTITLILLLIIIIVITLKWYYYLSSKILKNLPPSPPKLPIIGNLHQLSSSRPHQSLKSLAEKHGPLMLLHLGNKPVLIVSSAEAARNVLKTHDIAFASRPKTKFAGRLLYNYRDVSFAPYGNYWRQMRSICVLQLFSNKRVQSFRTLVEEEVGLMMNKIRKNSSTVLNFDDIFSTLTYDIICRAAIGKKYSSSSEEGGGSKFNKLFHELTDLLGVFNVGDYIPWLEWINYFNGLESKVSRVAKEFDLYLDHILQENMEKDDDNHKEAQNFVQVLLEIQNFNDPSFKVDTDIIKAIILDMLVAGTDTTYTLLQWAMTELVRDETKMAKLQNEVRINVGQKPIITDQDLSNMHYLKAVIKETLRLHPPLPLLLPHESQENVKLIMMGDYEIAKGTQVIINFWAIGKDTLSWEEDAEEFKPERFLNVGASGGGVDFKGNDYKFIPFGSGRRSCPASNFALSTAELTLASLMKEFDFGLPDGVEPKDIDMTESSGLTAHKIVPLLLTATAPEAGLQEWVG